jgi:hypothetical protein
MSLATMGINRLLGTMFLGVALLYPQILPAQGLSVTSTNGAVTVSWPAANFYDLLQTNTDLSQTNGWGNVGSASPLTALSQLFAVNSWGSSNFSGTSFRVSQPVANAGQFFRLKTPSFPFPLFSFAIFYDPLLEFSDSTTLTMSGYVHANGPIYTGAGTNESQTFDATVTTASTISSPDNAGFSSGAWGPVIFNGNPPFATNTPAFVSPFGTNNPHVLIEIPPAGESAASSLGQLRLYNWAQVLLLVSNSPAGGAPCVRVVLQASYNGQAPGADPSPLILMLTNATPAFLNTNSIIPLPFLSLTNTFADQRENQAGMYVAQIDVGAYGTWLSTNLTLHTAGLNNGGNNLATILYVADQRNIGTSKLAVVRLFNAQKLPPNTTPTGQNLGFSVATPNPLYLWGNYNTTQDGVHFALTLGATTNGYTVPAALFADAITVLSSSWSDAKSLDSYSQRNTVAFNLVMNAAIVAGNVPSTGTSAITFSGGVQNLTRMLENWVSVTLTYNTSLVCLYSSQMATNQFQMPGIYYNPPTRIWAFDPNFYDAGKLPPGTPFYTLP